MFFSDNYIVSTKLTYDVFRLKSDFEKIRKSIDRWAWFFNGKRVILYSLHTTEETVGPFNFSSKRPADIKNYIQTNLCIGIFKEILDELPIHNVQIVIHPPYFEIPRHRDTVKNHAYRIHIPITTNDGVRFSSKKDNLSLQVGRAYLLDTYYPHWTINGNTDRIHIIGNVAPENLHFFKDYIQ